MAIDGRDDLPTVAFKTLRCVISKPTFNFTIDRNTVVIVESDQLAKAQGTGQGTSFVGNTFHQATITQEGVGVVINDFVTLLVKLRSQGPFRKGHTYGVGNTLT